MTMIYCIITCIVIEERNCRLSISNKVYHASYVLSEWQKLMVSSDLHDVRMSEIIFKSKAVLPVPDGKRLSNEFAKPHQTITAFNYSQIKNYYSYNGKGGSNTINRLYMYQLQNTCCLLILILTSGK